MSSRRPRYADDEYDGDDDPRAHRSREMRSKRPPTPDSPDTPSTSRPQRRSILVDPDEHPKDRAARRRSRSNSQVRLKPPPSTYHSSDDDGSVDGRYVKHRNGKVEFIPSDDRKREPKKRLHDLEKKTDDSNGHFRAKRDGYESDEGNNLRKSKRRDKGDNIGDVDSDGDGPRSEKPKSRSAHESGRARSNRRDSRDGDSFVIPDRTRRRAGSAAPDGYSTGGRRQDPPRKRYDSEDDDLAPRRPRPSRKSYDAEYDRGYDTEGAGHRRRGWDDDDRAPRRRDRRSVRLDDDYPPTRRPPPKDDRLRPPPRSSRYGDGYDRYEDRPIRRARSDARARDRDRDRGGRVKDPRDKRNEWAKQAGTLFMTQAMPVIKREGGRWAKKEFENWMAQRR